MRDYIYTMGCINLLYLQATASPGCHNQFCISLVCLIIIGRRDADGSLLKLHISSWSKHEVMCVFGQL